MGRIKTQLTRRLTFEVLKQAEGKLTKTFDENKRVVSEYMPTAGKKMRNIVAGYATRLMRKDENS